MSGPRSESVDASLSRFDLGWLTDTGVTLGRGRQGIVRLMVLGSHTHVAVKAFNFR